MANDNNIIRVEENGIEYFTVVATGESGLSISGIARSLGTSHQAVAKLIRKVEKEVATEKLPESLKPLHGKVKTLATGGRYKNVTVYASLVWSALTEYYAFDAQKTTKEARLLLRATSAIGHESYVQSKTGWLPEKYQSSQESRDIIDFLVLNSPEKRDIHFDLNWRKEAERVTGYSWDGLPMAKFLRRAVYDFLPTPIVNRLTEVNPYFDGQRRNNKHYEHLEVGFDENILRQHIRDVYGVMRTSSSLSKFWQQMRSRFGIHIQRELDI